MINDKEQTQSRGAERTEMTVKGKKDRTARNKGESDTIEQIKKGRSNGYVRSPSSLSLSSDF